MNARELADAWRHVAQDFVRDGALRDVYVHDTSERDWDAVLELVRARYAPRYMIDGEPAPVPQTFSETMPVRDRASPSMHFDVDGIDVACHFFTHDEIEFDLRPEDVSGPSRFAALLDFVRALGDRVRKPVTLTYESMPEAIIVRYDAATGLLACIADE